MGYSPWGCKELDTIVRPTLIKMTGDPFKRSDDYVTPLFKILQWLFLQSKSLSPYNSRESLLGSDHSPHPVYLS